MLPERRVIDTGHTPGFDLMLKPLHGSTLFDETGTKRLVGDRPRNDDRMNLHSIIDIFHNLSRTHIISGVAERKPDTRVNEYRCHESALVIHGSRVRWGISCPGCSSSTSEYEPSLVLIRPWISINYVDAGSLVSGDVLFQIC